MAANSNLDPSSFSSKTWPGIATSGHLTPRKSTRRPKYAAASLDSEHPFLSNSKCIEGGHAAIIRRRSGSRDLRDSQTSSHRGSLHKSSRRGGAPKLPSTMPPLQKRPPAGHSAVQKTKKKNRASALFFGFGNDIVQSPTSTITPPPEVLPSLPLYKLDNSSFLHLFNADTSPSSAKSPSTPQTATTLPELSLTKSSPCPSPISPATPIDLPWAADNAYSNFLPTATVKKSPILEVPESPSTFSGASSGNNSRTYFSSSASQSSQSSVADDALVLSSQASRGVKSGYSLKYKARVCDLEGLQSVPDSTLQAVPDSSLQAVQDRVVLNQRTVSEYLSKDKPLPPEPLLDTSSSLLDLTCSAARPRSKYRPSTPDRLRRSSSISKKSRPISPRSPKSRGARLGQALILHAEGVQKQESRAMRSVSVNRRYSSQVYELPATLPRLVEKPKTDVVLHSPATEEEDFFAHTRQPLSLDHFDSNSSDLVTAGASDAPVPEGRHMPAPLRPSKFRNNRSMTMITKGVYHPEPKPADNVIFDIMSRLDIYDLLSASMVNKEFHHIFQKHELTLLKSAIFNTCPAAWEHLEEPGNNSNVPSIYLQAYKLGAATIASLRTSLLIRCDSLLRQETVTGLIRADKDRSMEINQAFWRIWTFCDIFGNKSSRRDTTQAQTEWLQSKRAGQMKDNKGNWVSHGGHVLSTAELLDIDEIWMCLNQLLQGFQDQPAEAQEVGLFDRCSVDDDHTEESYLQEWIAHVMTFGLSAILELSACSFEDAKASGWTRWSPAAGTVNEKPFLKYAVTSMYQRRVLEEAEARVASIDLPRKASARARNPRRRTVELAEGLRIQTQNLPRNAVGSPAKEPSLASSRHSSTIPEPSSKPESLFSPAAKASEGERRRSMASPVVTANMFQALSLQPRASTQLGPTLFPPKPASKRLSSAPPTLASSKTFPDATPVVPPRPKHYPAKASTIPVPSAPTAAVQHKKVVHKRPPIPQFHNQVIDPLDKAMTLLVQEMGFSAVAAKAALASCDNGTFLDVDQAVAMLLSEQPSNSSAVSRTPSVEPTELDSTPVETQAPQSLLQLQKPPSHSPTQIQTQTRRSSTTQPNAQSSTMQQSTAYQSQPKRHTTIRRTKLDIELEKLMPAYRAQTKLFDFVESSTTNADQNQKAQHSRSSNLKNVSAARANNERRQSQSSKAKAFKVLGVSEQERRLLTMAVR